MVIQKCFHIIWYQGFDKIPDKYKDNIDSLKSYHKHWKFIYWDESKIHKLIHDNYHIYYDFYTSYPEMIQKIDVAKYFILHYYGGVYCDIDVTCIKNIDNLLIHDLIFSEMNLSFIQRFLIRSINKNNIYVNNHFIGSSPGHNFWYIVFDNLEACLKRTSNLTNGSYIAQTTGPLFLSNMISKYKSDNYYVYTKNYFDPINCSTYTDYTNSETCIVHDSDNTWLTTGTKIIVSCIGCIEFYWLPILFIIILVIVVFIFLSFYKETPTFLITQS